MENPDQEINKLLSRMRPYLIAAGIKEEQVRVRSGKHKIDTYLKAFDWLHDLFMNAYYEYHVRVWNLVTPETWKSYKLHSITGLREQNMLRTSSLKVRTLWKSKRPQLFGKKRHANHKKTN